MTYRQRQRRQGERRVETMTAAKSQGSESSEQGVHGFIKVARYSFSGSIPPKFERKLRRHKQRFGKINTTVVLDKDENLL